jgi:uncharacterized membrane protein YphA (DoxX/SURF4 family)
VDDAASPMTDLATSTAEARVRWTALGRVVFAVALVGLGVLGLGSGDFAYLWQPVPTWAVGHPLLAYASGALLLACGAGLLWPRTVARASLALILYGAASMLLVHAPRIVKEPKTEGEWFGLGEVATIVAGAWILLAGAAPVAVGRWRKALVGERGVRLARILFALALPSFGLSHFVYAKTTAEMVPSWLPGHLAWAYFTGAAHMAAGLGILVGVLPRLAAALEALMVGVFLLTVNVPALVGKPGGRWEWTEVFVASVIGGAAFLVAQSYRGGNR